jgi:2-iminobutanoate/2-iminopropanoate deaminase
MKNHIENNPHALAAPDGHFSQCAVVESKVKMLYVSGQVPRDSAGKTVGVGNMSAQAEQVFQNLQAALAAHGATFEHVVKATLFVTRMDLAHEVVAVRRRYYGASKPASTFVGGPHLTSPIGG